MRTVLISLLALAFSVQALAQDRTYFVSPDGNDQASGLSRAKAWKTLDRVNQAVFQPGDRILLLAGAEFRGQLRPKGNGREGSPITLSSYGGDGRAVINIGDSEGAGIRLENQSWWIVEKMEVTSGRPPKEGIGRQGIVAVVKGENQSASHIIIRDNYIHDVWGMLGGGGEYSGYNSAAVLVQVQSRRNSGSMLSDVLVEMNRIERFDKCGIIVRGCRTNMTVRNNWMDNLGGDGIFCGGCDRGVIEYNEVHRSCMRSGYQDLDYGMDWWPHVAAIWIQDAEETVMQYNAVYDTGRQRGNGDGFAYDFDFYCKRCVCQYNYSKNNHGFMLLMNRTFENVSRYNISENDQTHLVQMQCDISDRNIFYNNVFYIDYGTADLDFFCGNDNTAVRSRLGAVYYNNIFYAATQSHFRTCYTAGEVLKRTFDENTRPEKGAKDKLFFHNCYYGPWKNGIPDDPEAVEEDPQMVRPGASGLGSESPGNVPGILAGLTGYQLLPSSPCIDRGIAVANDGGRDFYGGKVEDGHPDMGAYEMEGSGAERNDALAKEICQSYQRDSETAWEKWIFPVSLSADRTVRDGYVEIRLLESLRQDAKGTISWKGKSGKAVSLSIGDATQKDSFRLETKASLKELLASPVHVVLDVPVSRQEWDIPFEAAKK